MINNSDKGISISESLQNWEDLNEIQNEDYKYGRKQEVKILEKMLINKELSEADLGGLKALRGFVYQYFIAINYMIDIAYSDNWDMLVFELLDDIALIDTGQEKVRYIQVKTKREDMEERTLKISKDLVRRSDGLNGWIDKLFKGSSVEGNPYSSFSSEYELATNEKSKDVLRKYESNEDFNLKCISESDDLFISMQKSKAYKSTKDDKNKKEEKWNKEELKKNLKCFRIKNFSNIDTLKLNIVRKIASQNTSKESQIKYYKYVSSYAIQELLHQITVRTCDDSRKEPHNKLLFHKKEIKSWIDDGIELGKQQMHMIDGVENKRAYFKQIFESVRKNYESSWSKKHSEKLIEQLDILECMFIKEDLKDVYFYNRLTSKLLKFENNKNYRISKDFNEKSSIVLAIERLIILNVFYRENEMISGESSFIFKKGMDLLDNSKSFALCDAREDLTLSQSRLAIQLKAEHCNISKDLSYDFYCVINNICEEYDNPYDCSGNDTNIPSINDRELETPSLIEELKQIKFIDGEKQIKPFINHIRKKEEPELDNEHWKRGFESIIIQ